MASSITLESPILIVGAGVAGLTLAQGLRLRSIPFRLFERHSQSHSSQGHRFRISKEGLTSLNNALSPQLQTLLKQTSAERNRFEPRYIDVRKLEFPPPTPVSSESMPIDRTWIRMLSSLGIEDAVEYEKEFKSYEVLDSGVRVKFTDGSLAQGRLLVGADGIRSHVRRQLQPDRRLLDLERWLLWGRTPLTTTLREELPPDVLSWCMYHDHEANVQVVVEPMIWSKSVNQESGGKLSDFSDYIYWVVCTAPRQYADVLPKTEAEKEAFMRKVTETWHPSLKLLFGSAAHELSACVPVLSSKPDIELRSAGQTGRVTLIGDAAHAMSPMGGSGGDTAVRNAADLATTVADEGVTERSIACFEARMEERAREKIEHSFRGGQKFWRGKHWAEYSETDI
ncbi:FAD/NAD(P)-binding domain-containing protein [Xylariomycetidae sp. FL0641]|nr:FAD/NAD(P)-binding domain-containing protein [Xylariomycetidae sp. FL0641]